MSTGNGIIIGVTHRAFISNDSCEHVEFHLTDQGEARVLLTRDRTEGPEIVQVDIGQEELAQLCRWYLGMTIQKALTPYGTTPADWPSSWRWAPEQEKSLPEGWYWVFDSGSSTLRWAAYSPTLLQADSEGTPDGMIWASDPEAVQRSVVQRLRNPK